MSESILTKLIKRKIEDKSKPSSLVFVQTRIKNEKLEEISFLAVHFQELKAEEKPRVIDKLRLGFESRPFDKNAADQIAGFINLQASPVCLLTEADKTKQLATLKLNLETWNVSLAQNVWYSRLEDEPVPSKRAKVQTQAMIGGSLGSDNDSALDWVKRHGVTFLQSLVHQKFSNLKCDGLRASTSASSGPKSVPVRFPDETLLFLDLEATGTPAKKITELFMMAVPKQRLLETGRGLIPKGCDKLTLVIDPESDINPFASVMSNLTWSGIARSKKKPFNKDVAAAVCQFLKRFSDSVCLVSHGGRNFDFSALRTHLAPYHSLAAGLGYLKAFDTVEGFRNMKKIRGSLKLGNLYSRCFGEMPPESHTAESDVVSLIKVVTCFPGVLDIAKKSKFF